jgi:hypothetical protein
VNLYRAPLSFFPIRPEISRFPEIWRLSRPNKLLDGTCRFSRSYRFLFCAKLIPDAARNLNHGAQTPKSASATPNSR